MKIIKCEADTQIVMISNSVYLLLCLLRTKYYSMLDIWNNSPKWTSLLCGKKRTKHAAAESRQSSPWGKHGLSWPNRSSTTSRNSLRSLRLCRHVDNHKACKFRQHNNLFQTISRLTHCSEKWSVSLLNWEEQIKLLHQQSHKSHYCLDSFVCDTRGSVSQTIRGVQSDSRYSLNPPLLLKILYSICCIDWHTPRWGGVCVRVHVFPCCKSAPTGTIGTLLGKKECIKSFFYRKSNHNLSTSWYNHKF